MTIVKERFRAMLQHRGGILLAALAATGIVVGSLNVWDAVSRPTRPWADYSAAYVGDRDPDSNLVSRLVTDDEIPRPVVPAGERLPMNVARCGPTAPTPVMSVRSWQILDGEFIIDTPFTSTFEGVVQPPDDGDDCAVVGFSTIDIPLGLAVEGDGRPVRFILTITTAGCAPVEMVSEWMIPALEPVELWEATELVQFEIPEPLRTPRILCRT